MTPDYSAVAGKLWLERGGVFVVANVRGGGEFGPRGTRPRSRRTATRRSRTSRRSRKT